MGNENAVSTHEADAPSCFVGTAHHLVHLAIWKMDQEPRGRCCLDGKLLLPSVDHHLQRTFCTGHYGQTRPTQISPYRDPSILLETDIHTCPLGDGNWNCNTHTPTASETPNKFDAW